MSWFLRSSVLGAALALGAAGCSFDLGLDQSTHGESDTLRFSYGGNELFECLFGCSLSRPMAEGSTVDVAIFGAPVDAKLSARTKSGVAKVVSLEPTYSCESTGGTSGGSSTTVAADEPCAKNETRSVVWLAKIAASSPGSTGLEVLDAKGHVVDATTLEVARPTTAILFRGTDASASNAIDVSNLTLSPGEVVILKPQLSDAAGRELELGRQGAKWSFADPGVVEQGSALDDFLGAPYDGVLRAKGAGQTTLTLEVGTLVVPVSVTVTP